MKTTTLIAIAATISLMGLASAKEKKARKPLPPEIVAKFDADGDGKLNKEEMKAARAELKKGKKAKNAE